MSGEQKPRLRQYNGKWYPAERAARMALIDTIRVGDLVRVNGVLRVVRGVWPPPKRSSMPRDQVYGIEFAIRRCSWTRRPTTAINRSQLYLVPFEIVRRGYGADRTPVGRLLQEELRANRGTSNRGALCCRDVAKVIA